MMTTDESKPQREPDWTEEDERALNNELPPRAQNQHSKAAEIADRWERTLLSDAQAADLLYVYADNLEEQYEVVRQNCLDAQDGYRREFEKRKELEEQYQTALDRLWEAHDQLCGCDKPADEGTCSAPEETWGAFEYLGERERDLNPASDPLGLDQADRDFAEGKARPASEVFADLGLDSNQDRDPASEPEEGT